MNSANWLAGPAIGLLLVATLFCGGHGSGGTFQECGNGALEGAEDCDDGATIPCDGCSASCTVETGHLCGDGTLNASCGEQCDDGNTLPGDGCDAECLSEACGNGTVDAGEECDDGNRVPCDGCSASCSVETGLVCGDGTLNASCGEQCDDGNTTPCDGCSPSCSTEIGYVCGDGTLNASCGEQCDDGNTTPCDGCSASCGVETGHVCGDGTMNATCGEQCDDGNTTPCDGCSASCSVETGHVCGDGTMNATCGEQCDDGNTNDGDGCDANCQIEVPLVLSGDYLIQVDTAIDTCGFVDSPESSPMNVEELDPTLATIDIPVGGAGGACNRQEFMRSGNTLTRTESSQQPIGACTVLVDVTSVFDFFAAGDVTGSETYELSAVSGDCSGLTLPCTVKFTVTGSPCTGCFECVSPTNGPRRPGPGLLGAR